MTAHRGLLVRDARRCRAAHHEGLLRTSSEEARSAVSKDEAAELEVALERQRFSKAGNMAKDTTGRLRVTVKSGGRLKLSSKLWLERQLNDPYVAQARRDGLRSRAAYK